MGMRTVLLDSVRTRLSTHFHKLDEVTEHAILLDRQHRNGTAPIIGDYHKLAAAVDRLMHAVGSAGLPLVERRQLPAALVHRERRSVVAIAMYGVKESLVPAEDE